VAGDDLRRLEGYARLELSDSVEEVGSWVVDQAMGDSEEGQTHLE
jgi:hypothetical protein